MPKNKSKGKIKTYIKPKQLRDALIMTGREYIKTKEYQQKSKRQAKTFLEEFKKRSEFKQFEKLAKEVNQKINSSGIPEAIKRIQECYSSILKESRPKEKFISPKLVSNTPPFLSTEIIGEISQKTAEKIFKKLKEMEAEKQSIKKKMSPPNVAPGTRWENIRIRIIDENNVVILIGNSKYETNYKKMGFEDERTGYPNKQWMFLWLLAINNGALSWEDYRDNNRLSNLSLKDINKFKKIKQLLAETLKNYFKINEDPFYSYRKEKAYRIRINLTSARPDEFSP